MEDIVDFEKLQLVLEDIQCNCAERVRKQQKPSIDAHNCRTGIGKIDFTKGDYVLEALLQKSVPARTRLEPQGPSHITECQDD